MGLDIYFNRHKLTEIGYFRKVNFLVKFFADKGFDVLNQTPFIINKKDAEELFGRCEDVLKDHSKASTLLPTMSGFLFGSTKYDEDHYNNVQRVKDYIEDTLIPNFDNLKDDEYIEFSTWY